MQLKVDPFKRILLGIRILERHVVKFKGRWIIQ